MIFSSIKAGLILYVLISGSTKTGVQPHSLTAKIEAIYVFEGTNISSPSLKSKAIIASFNASSPFATPTAYFAPQNFAKLLQNSSFSLPSKYQPLSNTFFILSSISFLCLSFILYKSKNLIISGSWFLQLLLFYIKY